jgi:hypothetical protein
MSLHIHCSGCGRHVEVEANEQHELIKSTEFKIGEGFHSDKPMKSDLCVRCIDQIRMRYYGGDPSKYDREVETLLLGPPDLPDFLERESQPVE